MRKTSKQGVDKLLMDGAGVMWCGAHPDDEGLVGSILAKTGPALGNPLYFLVLTHGDGGECCIPGGCKPDLVTVRGEEMKRVAEMYKAELQHEYLYNAPLPVKSFPKRHEIAKIWNDQKDTTLICAEAIRKFKPDILFTFQPDFGFTGHPEHQIASRFATAGVRMAANEDSVINDLAPHKVPYVYYGLNKYWLFRMFGKADPGKVTEVWDAMQPCVNGMNCRDLMAEITKCHESQARDMGAVRKMKWLIEYQYLYLTDPFTEILDPFEPA